MNNLLQKVTEKVTFKFPTLWNQNTSGLGNSLSSTEVSTEPWCNELAFSLAHGRRRQCGKNTQRQRQVFHIFLSIENVSEIVNNEKKSKDHVSCKMVFFCLGGRGSRVVRGCTFVALDRLDPLFFFRMFIRTGVGGVEAGSLVNAKSGGFSPLIFSKHLRTPTVFPQLWSYEKTLVGVSLKTNS